MLIAILWNTYLFKFIYVEITLIRLVVKWGLKIYPGEGLVSWIFFKCTAGKIKSWYKNCIQISIFPFKQILYKWTLKNLHSSKSSQVWQQQRRFNSSISLFVCSFFLTLCFNNFRKRIGRRTRARKQHPHLHPRLHLHLHLHLQM